MTQQQLCKVDINWAFNDEMHFLPEFGSFLTTIASRPGRAALLRCYTCHALSCCHRCYESIAAAAAGRSPSVPTPA
jgi:hypothetical protein